MYIYFADSSLGQKKPPHMDSFFRYDDDFHDIDMFFCQHIYTLKYLKNN